MAADGLVKTSTIGSGTYGIVYQALPSKLAHLNNVPQKKIAVKRNLIDLTTDFAGSLRELDILNKFNGYPFVVQLLNISFGDPFKSAGGRMSPIKERIYKDDKIHFIFEHANYDLHSFIYDVNSPTSLAKSSIVQCLLCVEFMHAKGIIHRDIKPPNVLVFSSPEGETFFKICDFGLAKPYTNQGNQSPRTVTPWYRAPEICLGWSDYSYKSDIWSLGCVFYETITKRALLQGADEDDEAMINILLGFMPQQISQECLQKMTRGKKLTLTKVSKPRTRRTWAERLNFPSAAIQRFDSTESGPGTYAQFADLLSHILAFDPDERWTATQALAHPFFDGYRQFIATVREAFPPVKDPEKIIDIIDCIERKWAFQVLFNCFNERTNADVREWYSHRIIFQAADMFDRYLTWAWKNKPLRELETDDCGRLHNEQETTLRIYLCIYTALKYFATLQVPISFHKLVEKQYRTKESFVLAEQFEIELLSEVLEYSIYRDTMYEIADAFGEKLDDGRVRELLMIYGMTTSYSGITPSGLYELYKVARVPESSSTAAHIEK